MYCDNEVINNKCWKIMYRLVKYCLKFIKWLIEIVLIIKFLGWKEKVMKNKKKKLECWKFSFLVKCVVKNKNYVCWWFLLY